MSEKVLIALIGIIPSTLVAIVSIISNNIVLKLRIDQLQKQVDNATSIYEKTDILRKMSYEQLMTHRLLQDIIARIEKLEQKFREE